MGKTAKKVARPALFLGTLAAAGLAAWVLFGRPGPLAEDPLARVPATATAVALIDTRAVLGSPLWDRIVTSHGGDEGIRRIERTCGFDPLAQLDDVVLFATGDAPDRLDRVGVVARGELDREALADCVAEVVSSEGGEVRRVTIEGVPAVAGRGSSRAAFVGANGVVAGSEPLVRDVVRVTQGDIESVASDDTLARLWQRVADGRHLVVAAHLPGPWRSALRRMATEGERASLETLAGARAFGAGVRVTRGLGAGIALEMRSEAEAREGERAVRAEIERTLDQTMVALSPIAPALRRVDVEPQGKDLVITVELSSSQVDELVDLVEDLLERSEQQARRREPALAPQPDEVVRPGG